MAIKRGLMNKTTGIPIPLVITLMGERFNLREFVINTALTSENRPLKKKEEERIIEITTALRDEFQECWKIESGTDHCRGILRAARILINLLHRRRIPKRKKEIEDLKRWLEYGRKL